MTRDSANAKGDFVTVHVMLLGRLLPFQCHASAMLMSAIGCCAAATGTMR